MPRKKESKKGRPTIASDKRRQKKVLSWSPALISRLERYCELTDNNMSRATEDLLDEILGSTLLFMEKLASGELPKEYVDFFDSLDEGAVDTVVKAGLKDPTSFVKLVSPILASLNSSPKQTNLLDELEK